MRLRFLFAAFVFIAVFAGLWHFLPSSYDLVGVYDRKFQTALFSGFLTVGSFLLSLKTFIIVQLRDKLYEMETYKTRVKDRQKLNPKITAYGPLSRLGSFLVYSVGSAYLTAISQFTIGLIKQPFAAAICIALGGFTLTLVFFSWWEIRANLKDWFELLEEDDRKKKEKEAQAGQH